MRRKTIRTRLGPTRLTAGLCLLALVVSLAACGSSAPTGSRTTGTESKGAACQAVAAALSDGPDPGADPVGHAEAQILPLHEIHAADQVLERAVQALSGAYRTFYLDKGAAAGKKVVKAALARVETFCPGVAS